MSAAEHRRAPRAGARSLAAVACVAASGSLAGCYAEVGTGVYGVSGPENVRSAVAMGWNLGAGLQFDFDRTVRVATGLGWSGPGSEPEDGEVGLAAGPYQLRVDTTLGWFDAGGATRGETPDDGRSVTETGVATRSDRVGEDAGATGPEAPNPEDLILIRATVIAMGLAGDIESNAPGPRTTTDEEDSTVFGGLVGLTLDLGDRTGHEGAIALTLGPAAYFAESERTGRVRLIGAETRLTLFLGYRGAWAVLGAIAAIFSGV